LAGIVLGIVTCYWLDCLGIKLWWGQDSQPPVQWVLGLFLGLKSSGRDVEHHLASSTEVKERVKLYLYFPSRP